MLQKRHLAASVLDSKGDMWILGGTTGLSNAADSTERYEYPRNPKGRGKWKKSYPLPQYLRDRGLESHCALSINSTHKFISGGFSADYIAKETLRNSGIEFIGTYL